MNVQNSTFAAMIGGGASIIASWAIQQFGHVPIPAEISSAFTGMVMAALTHWVPDAPAKP